jgi:hypothetical protein
MRISPTSPSIFSGTQPISRRSPQQIAPKPTFAGSGNGKVGDFVMPIITGSGVFLMGLIAVIVAKSRRRRRDDSESLGGHNAARPGPYPLSTRRDPVIVHSNWNNSDDTITLRNDNSNWNNSDDTITSRNNNIIREDLPRPEPVFIPAHIY